MNRASVTSVTSVTRLHGKNEAGKLRKAFKLSKPPCDTRDVRDTRIWPNVPAALPGVLEILETMKTTTTKQTYRHQFKGGIVATLTLPDFNCQWSRRPSRSLAREYFSWRDMCIAQFAKEMGLRIMVVTPPAI